MKEFFERFAANLAEPPAPGPELIPAHRRVPFFVGVVVVSAALLALVVWYVVVPGVRAQQTRPAAVRSESSK